MQRTTYKQILSATHGVLNQISNHYRTGKWVGTLNDFITYDESQTLTTPMVRDLLKAIKKGELDLPISFLGKVVRIKTRNWHAVNANDRKAGAHTHKKKHQSKNDCRKSKSQKWSKDEA